MIWEPYPDGDIAQAIDGLWQDKGSATRELAEAYIEVAFAQDDEPLRDALLSAGEAYEVGALLVRGYDERGRVVHFPVLPGIIADALRAIGAPAIEPLQKLFRESQDVGRKIAIANLLAQFGEAAAESVSILAAEVANPGEPEERCGLRCTTAYALGTIGVASAEVVEALTRVAGAADEAQPLRSYCIEALMDLGPSAAAAIPVLERVLKDDEDDDLRQFAWSALKSVGSASRDHPCGGTVAQHMRSLYRGVGDWELRSPPAPESYRASSEWHPECSGARPRRPIPDHEWHRRVGFLPTHAEPMQDLAEQGNRKVNSGNPRNRGSHATGRQKPGGRFVVRP
jgi:hypothetical protein